MKRLLYISVALLALHGCRKEPRPADGDNSRVPIAFGISSVESMHGTKAIIEDLTDLEEECTPVSTTPFTLKESIGVSVSMAGTAMFFML